MNNLNEECGLTTEEREECAIIDAVTKLVPNADPEDIYDLMPSGYTVKQIAAELKVKQEEDARWAEAEAREMASVHKAQSDYWNDFETDRI